MKHKLYTLSMLALLATMSVVTSCGKTSSSASSTTGSSDTSSSVDSTTTSPSQSTTSSSTISQTQKDFQDFQEYMSETVLKKEVREATFAETNSQDGFENRVRTTEYGVDEVLTTIAGDEDYLQYAAIRDGIYYTATGGEEGGSVSRQLITDKTGADTTTEEVARNTLNRYLEIADFRKTEIFDVFTAEDAVATLFKQDGDVITLAAYRETDSIYNYAYTIVLNVNDQDQIVSLEGQVDFADADHWDDVNKVPTSTEDSYQVYVKIDEGDLVYGTLSADAPLLYDFSGCFVTSVEAEIYAEDTSGMGGATSGEANELKVGDYLTVQVLSYLPETAVDGYSGNFQITGSSDTTLVSPTPDGYGYYVPEQAEDFTEGSCEVYVGNIFNEKLDTVTVHVTGSGSSSQGNEPVVYGFEDAPGFEYIGSEDLEGRFTIDVDAMEPAVFSAMTLVPGPFSIQGDEIQIDDPNLVAAMFQENPEGGMKIDLAMMAIGGYTGSTLIHVPYTFNGMTTVMATFEVVVARSPKLMMVNSQDGYEDLWEGECYGRFTLSLAEGEKAFSVQLSGMPPYQITGEEITSDDPEVATASFQGDEENGYSITIVPKKTGTTIIRVPSMMGTWPYEVVIGE